MLFYTMGHFCGIFTWDLYSTVCAIQALNGKKAYCLFFAWINKEFKK